MTAEPAPLRALFLDAPLTAPLLGTREWAGRPVDVEVGRSVDAGSRAMLRGDHDVAEMSFATYLWARGHGDPLRALPAFTGRRLLQSHIGVRAEHAGAGAEGLRDLRVAAFQYWMTSSLWHRVLLLEGHGVDTHGLTWCTTTPERFDLAAAGGTRVERVDDGRTPAQLVIDGDADVFLSPRPRPEGLHPLFVDEQAEEQRWLARTGVLPLMHLVVTRSDLDPDLVAAIWDDLEAARAASGAPPYGVQANEPAIDAALAGARRDGLLARQPELDELFWPTHTRASTP